MSSFYTYTMTETDLTKLCNQSKELFVSAMVHNKFITKAQAKEIKENYAVIVKKKGWLGETWDKIRGTNEDGMQIVIVKCALSVDYDDDEETTENDEEDGPICEAEG